MKNRKGEIATLLTLGLVLIGTAVTIATSFIANNRKNIASNPRAAGNVCCRTYGVNLYDCKGTDKSKVMYIGTYGSTCADNRGVECSSIAGAPTSTGYKCLDLTGETGSGGSGSGGSGGGRGGAGSGGGRGGESGSATCYGRVSARTVCGGPDNITNEGCKSGTYRCTAELPSARLNYGSSIRCANNPDINYYKIGSKYYESKSDTVGTTVLNSICVAPAGGGSVDPGQGNGQGSGNGGEGGISGPGVVGPGQSCCFTKKGLIYEFASYGAMINSDMPLDCSRQTNALVKSYRALNPPGAFVCNTGSAGQPYNESQIIVPDLGEETPPGGEEEPIEEPEEGGLGEPCIKTFKPLNYKFTYSCSGNLVCSSQDDSGTCKLGSGGGGTTINKTEYACPTNKSKNYWAGSDGKFYSSKTDTTGDSNVNAICYGSCTGPSNCIGDANRYSNEVSKEYYFKSVSGSLTFYENSTCSTKVGGSGNLSALKTYCTIGGGGTATGEQCTIVGESVIEGKVIDAKADIGQTRTVSSTTFAATTNKYNVFRYKKSNGSCGYDCISVVNGKRYDCWALQVNANATTGRNNIIIKNNKNTNIKITGISLVKKGITTATANLSPNQTIGPNTFGTFDFKGTNAQCNANIGTKLHVSVHYEVDGVLQILPTVQFNCEDDFNGLININ